MQYAGYPRFDPMMGMTDMHTHDDSGTLHWEIMKGPVTKEDVRIGSFFRVWEKLSAKIVFSNIAVALTALSKCL